MPVSYEHHDSDDDHDADGDPHSIAPNLSRLCPAQLVIADLRQPSDAVVDGIDNVGCISASEPDIGLDDALIVQPIEAPASEPQAMQCRAPATAYQVLGRLGMAQEQHIG